VATVASTRHVILAVADGALWAAWSASCGYLAHRTPAARLQRDRLLSIRGFERDGRSYERVLHIKAWKDALPEAGSLFRGGLSKAHLPGHDPESLARFATETRRAERTHWAILALAPTFFAWNPWWLATAMLAYGLAANVPCLLVQRYNRARLLSIASIQPGSRTTPTSPSPDPRLIPPRHPGP
jgi:glycosyl-4,4'-diaponeurosporenoate acyltransferase